MPQPVSGTCSVSPSPVPVGSEFTVAASDLAPDTVYNVEVREEHGVQVAFMGTDAQGAGSTTLIAWWTGTSTVEVMLNKKGNKRVMVATCTFEVV